MRDVNRLSRRVPVLCKVAPSVPNVHLEDVHRAGGIMAILGELERAGLIDANVRAVHSATLSDALARWDIRRSADEDHLRKFYCAAPGGVPTTVAFSQEARFGELDLDRAKGRDPRCRACFQHRWGLAVLYGNLAEDGSIVKTAGVDPAVLTFSGPARVFESQDKAVEDILSGAVKAG